MTPSDLVALVARLRARLITIRKPDTQPFDPPAGFAYTTMMGGEHKPGDPAGYASININITACGSAPSVFKMQEMVYAEEPLSWDAAAAIEQLQAEMKAAQANEEAMKRRLTEVLEDGASLRAELAAVKAREPEAWFFECWTRGKHAQFASVDIDDHSWWPVDQWIIVHRTPLCLNGEKECLYDARAQGEK